MPHLQLVDHERAAQPAPPQTLEARAMRRIAAILEREALDLPDELDATRCRWLDLARTWEASAELRAPSAPPRAAAERRRTRRGN